MNEQLNQLIEFAIADGVVTEKERAVLYKKALELGVDKDELGLVLDGKLHLKQQEIAKQSTQKTTTQKHGDFKKCPSCGAPIESFSTKCTDCGHDFSNIQASSSVQKLFEMLNELEKQRAEDETNPLKALGNTYSKMFQQGGVFGDGKLGQQKRELIKNFPIAITREDILEFLSLAVPRAKKKGNFFTSNFSDGAWEIKAHNLIVPIWRTKCEEIIMKARFAMKNDKQTLSEIEFYAKELGIK